MSPSPTGTSPALICPLCATTVAVNESRCTGCGIELSEYARVYYHPDRLFNDGLTKLARQQWTQAAQLFAEVCRYRPRDVAALRAWAHAAVADGRYEEALGVLLEAMDVQDSPDLQESYAAVVSLCGLRDQGVATAWVELAGDLRSAVADLTAAATSLSAAAAAETAGEP